MKNAPQFDYDKSQSLDVRMLGPREEDGISWGDLTYAVPFGRRRAAYLVRPSGEGPFPAILYVHWYEPTAQTSNRTQFFDEARAMAKRGVVSLLVETLWSDRDWFIKRTHDDDLRQIGEQVVELRLAMDLLLQQAGVDPKRFAYVGHDFGAMYGVVMGSVDSRPTCYTLMAGTPRFPDWFFYYPQIEGEAREEYLGFIATYDPISCVGRLAPAPILYQFGREDPHVPVDRAEEFFAETAEPKSILWYEGGHGLNEQASKDRMAWLARQLGLVSA